MSTRRTPAAQSDEGERLAKRVAQMVPCSRREAEQYIEGGWVRVDGTVVEEPMHRVTHQTVTLDREASLLNLTPVTLVLNKPPGVKDGSSLLTPANHWKSGDTSGTRLLKRHFSKLSAPIPLEHGASGLVVFTQDWRVQRKLEEDIATMEHELLVDVAGEVAPDALTPIQRALKDERRPLPAAKVSVNSSTPEGSRLRFAIKGAHPGLAAHLCDLAGLDIRSMRRTRLGRVALSDLPVGQWRYLAGHERF
jgi:23S rRNA pseudouridine2604 synthase